MAGRRKNRRTETSERSYIEDISLSSNLNPKYTFNSFVSGSSNQLAFTAALTVANSLADSYNPLIIYGSYGLGKTHLLHAIGNHVLALNKMTRIVYCTSEQFMNGMINCLRSKKMGQFRKFFRNSDLLLMDNVQFLAGKEATQEQFYLTFDALYESHKQIVITSDRLPKYILYLEENLLSRLEGGLYVEIRPPDLETMLVIIKRKAEFHKIHIPDDVVIDLATNCSRDVRELGGCLFRLKAYSSLQCEPITMEMARKCLKDVLADR